MGGTVHSSAGTAAAFSGDTAVFTVQAAATATLIGMGDVGAQVTSSGDASVFAGGLLTGSVQADHDAGVYSYGDLSAGVNAGNDANVASIGDLSSTVIAGHDLRAVSYGDLDADYTAGHDVVLVGARGDITGSIAAADAIQRVASYASINATISAGDANNPGTVQLVEAYGDVAGSITASQAIQTVRSAHLVTASLNAPDAAAPDSNDHSVMVDYPEVPNTSLASVWAALADNYHGVLDGKAAMAADAVGLTQVLGAGHAMASYLFQPSMGELAAAVADLQDAKLQLQAQIAQLQDGAQQQLLAAQAAQEIGWRQLEAQANVDKAAFVAQLHQLELTLEQQLAELKENAAEAEQLSQLAINAQQVATQVVLARFDQERYVDRPVDFDADIKQMVENGIHAALQIIHDTLTIVGFFDRTPITGVLQAALYTAEGKTEEAASELKWAAIGGMGSFLKVLRFGKILDRISDINAIRRVTGAAKNGLHFLVPIGKQCSWVTKLVKGTGCFVAGTMVWMDEPDERLVAHSVDAAPPPLDESADSNRWVWSSLLVGVGIVGWQWAERRHRRREEQQRQAAWEQMFAQDEGDSLSDDDAEEPFMLDEPFHWVEDVDALCDALFHGDESFADECPFQLNGSGPPSSSTDSRHALSIVAEEPTMKATVSSTPAALKVESDYAASPQVSRKPGKRSRFGLAWLSACVLLAAYLAFGRSTSLPDSPQQAVNQPTAASAEASRLKPIEQIRVGERLAGRNPLREQVELVEPDPAAWQRIGLRMRKASGAMLWIELLRPLAWIKEHSAKVGGAIYIELPEMGAVGNAEVTFVGPCPEISAGPGTVVTGTFKHQTDENNKIVHLELEDQIELSGVTDNHPYWSEDRRDFIAAGELLPGELVDTEYGLKHVVSVTPIQHNGFLYNFETTEHVYRVGSLGTLVHNTCGIVYRVIRATENPLIGLVAKNPANTTRGAAFHVSRGSQFATRFISTTKSRALAEFYAKRDGLRVVAIDLSKIGKSQITDLTNPTVRDALLKHPIPRNIATASKEVLLEGFIPPHALEEILLKP